MYRGPEPKAAEGLLASLSMPVRLEGWSHSRLHAAARIRINS